MRLDFDIATLCSHLLIPRRYIVGRTGRRTVWSMLISEFKYISFSFSLVLSLSLSLSLFLNPEALYSCSSIEGLDRVNSKICLSEFTPRAIPWCPCHRDYAPAHSSYKYELPVLQSRTLFSDFRALLLLCWARTWCSQCSYPRPARSGSIPEIGGRGPIFPFRGVPVYSRLVFSLSRSDPVKKLIRSQNLEKTLPMGQG